MSQPPQGPPHYPQNPQQPQGHYAGGPPQPINYQGAPMNAGKPQGMAITSMVLGICTFFPTCCLSWLSLFVAPILAILAIIFGVVSLKAVGRGEASGGGMAKAGLILGIIYMALWVVIIILAMLGVGLAAFGASSGNFNTNTNNSSSPTYSPDEGDATEDMPDDEAADDAPGEFKFDFE